MAGKADSVTEVCSPGSERLTESDSVTVADPDPDAARGGAATCWTRPADRDGAFTADAWPEPGKRSPKTGSIDWPAPGTASGPTVTPAPEGPTGPPGDMSTGPGSAAASGTAAGPGSGAGAELSGGASWPEMGPFGAVPGPDDVPGSVEPPGGGGSVPVAVGDTVPF